MPPTSSHVVRIPAVLGCVLALAIAATGTTAATAKVKATAATSVRSCGRGEVQEYPYFDVRAQRTSCAVAQHLIRSFLCTNARGHCAPHSHWRDQAGTLIGRWTSPAGWHCQARIPPALYVDGKPFGSELCRRGSARVSSQSYG
jgi:hypothetical protein